MKRKSISLLNSIPTAWGSRFPASNQPCAPSLRWFWGDPGVLPGAFRAISWSQDRGAWTRRYRLSVQFTTPGLHEQIVRHQVFLVSRIAGLWELFLCYLFYHFVSNIITILSPVLEVFPRLTVRRRCSPRATIIISASPGMSWKILLFISSSFVMDVLVLHKDHKP